MVYILKLLPNYHCFHFVVLELFREKLNLNMLAQLRKCVTRYLLLTKSLDKLLNYFYRAELKCCEINYKHCSASTQNIQGYSHPHKLPDLMIS